MLTSTSPSEIADYIVPLVYFYITILLYLPLLHRLKLLIISLCEYIYILLYSCAYLYLAVSNCWLYRYISAFLCYHTLIHTSISPSKTAAYIAILVYCYATILWYLPLFHRLKLLILSLYKCIIMLLYSDIYLYFAV